MVQASDVPFLVWFGQNIGVIVPILIFIIGSLFALSHRYKLSIDARLKEHRSVVEGELKLIVANLAIFDGTQRQNTKEIAVLQTHRENITMQLAGIVINTAKTNEKIDELRNAIMERSFLPRG